VLYLLRWEQRDLSHASSVSLPTIDLNRNPALWPRTVRRWPHFEKRSERPASSSSTRTAAAPGCVLLKSLAKKSPGNNELRESSARRERQRTGCPFAKTAAEKRLDAPFCDEVEANQETDEARFNFGNRATPVTPTPAAVIFQSRLPAAGIKLVDENGTIKPRARSSCSKHGSAPRGVARPVAWRSAVGRRFSAQIAGSRRQGLQSPRHYY